MRAHLWRHDASSRRGRRFRPVFVSTIEAGVIAVAVATAALPIHADSIKTGAAPVDTEHLFGFVEGADIGNSGEREFVLDSSSRAGRASGSFAVTTSELEFKCVPKLADFGRHGPWLLRPRQRCGHRGCPA